MILHITGLKKFLRSSIRLATVLLACTVILSPALGCSSGNGKSGTVKASSKTASSASSVSTAAKSGSSSQKSSAAASAAKILKVKNIQQMPELQSGCEITAASILLGYYGYDVTKTDLLKFLPCSSDFMTVNGKAYGPNPWKTFAGDPETDRYGCYAPVLTNTINDYLLRVKGRHIAIDLTGTPADELYTCIDAGIPVIVWVTIGMAEPTPGEGWYLNDSGDYYQWVLKEHCMVLIGYTQTQAVFSDPYDSRGTVYYDKKLFAQRYQQLYSQAVLME